jgi:hypothetical protein
VDEHSTEIWDETRVFRQSTLESSEQTIEADLKRFVVTGVERRLIQRDAASGLAFAEATLPVPSEPLPGASFEERQAWSRDPWFEEYRAVQNLRYALRCPGMQEVALRAMGAPLAEAGIVEQMVASSLCERLSVVASGFAPPGLSETVKPALDAELEAQIGTRLWHEALLTAVRTLRMRPELGRPRQKVEWVLEIVRISTKASDLPLPFRNPTERQLKRAEGLFARLEGARPGRAKGEWALASAFAKEMGAAMPARRRDATRAKGARSLAK